ncbi:Short-chain dehydrogenase/reductase SDR [Lasiodiplodia theobromae]|uniref:Short-chain dehydrogenase/reductase SDR n=1 Tax=Lasiodiplodia theobromae TaxID=45133 RepID=UPI0015C39CFB|nr:Short-chain dehydrogenase/reductase SDR [Lasiodiplodia theobromae]KAF4540342.1 Short-chain dehydrogenase/reductase SDR [Lasiodiplodia theobromae]
MASSNFDPEKDIPELSGKVIFITGGTSGLGAESVAQLAKRHPRAIYFSGRNAKSAEGVIEKVKASTPDAPALHFVQCDLASLQSVAAAAQQVLDQEDRLDVLMCNAGIMATPTSLTTDGYEVQFGTNHVGHALLIKKLLPLLVKTSEQPGADVRIVILTSLGFALHPHGGIVFNDLKTVQNYTFFGGFRRYGQSKLANLLYARELARRYPQITTLSIHPGVVSTGLAGQSSLINTILIYILAWWQMVPPEKGAHNQLWAAAGKVPKEKNGEMYEPVGVLSTKLDETAKDDKLAEQLWDWTQKELEKY